MASRALLATAAFHLCAFSSLGVLPPVAAESIDDPRRTPIVRAIEQVRPAVVSIHAVHREAIYYRARRDPFFDLLAPPWFYGGQQDKVTAGSGFIVSDDGTILTNDHVVGKRPVRITVNLVDGRELEARHVGSDYYVDLAVLKVDAPDLPVAPLGAPGDILVGERAIAIGNPFDLGVVASAGIVSALDKDFGEPQGSYYYRDMIQTDATINPGNSGGPLVNALGQVIGINSFIYTDDNSNKGSIGIGFAIPIEAARRFLEEITAHGKVRPPWHGILGLRTVRERLARYLELPSTDGAYVDRVAVGSPAYEAGLGRGDVILEINDESVRSAKEAKGMLQRLRVGETCSLRLFSDGRSGTISFIMGDSSDARSRRN